MVYYNHSFILFGGWLCSSTHPPYLRSKMINELHIYNIKINRWSIVNSSGELPPPTAAHSASIHGDLMVVFGGLNTNYSNNNDVWCLNLNTYTWYKRITSKLKPQPRYGHSQIALDEKKLIIIGGCLCPYTTMNDVWLLNMNESTWTWEKITMKKSQFAPIQIWLYQACRLGNHVIVLGEKKQISKEKIPQSRRQRAEQKSFNTIKIEMLLNRSLFKHEDKFSIFCLNIENILDGNYTTHWMEYSKELKISSNIHILYSLVVGSGELIVFGGIRKKLMSTHKPTDNHDFEATNELFFIRPL